MVIHGGPTGVDRTSLAPDRYYPVERFVARGALVLRPNYRGSAGYGEKFRSLNVRDLGVGDYANAISGVDFLIAKGWVDPAKVGAMGWSEGGYISAFITASSDRFRAVSVGAGISDWTTYYVNTDIHPFTRQYLQATPWDDPEIYKKTSPISYVKAAKTPDSDTARGQRQAGAHTERIRVIPGIAGPTRAGAHGGLSGVWAPDRQAQTAEIGHGRKHELVLPLDLG